MALRPRITLDEAKGLLHGSQPGGRGRRRCSTARPANVDAYRTMQSFVAGARAYGAEIREFTPVTPHSTPRTGAIETAGNARAVQIVPGKSRPRLGPWSHKVARSAGLRLPHSTRRSRRVISRPPAPPDFYARPPAV